MTRRMSATRSLGDIASILRLHIIAIAVTAALVFGKILTGELWVAVALLGGLDWLLINLLNRVSDVEEDSANQIRGTEKLVGRHRLVLGVWIGILVGSMVLGYFLAPELMIWRTIVQLVGVGYSYRIVPTTRGLRRQPRRPASSSPLGRERDMADDGSGGSSRPWAFKRFKDLYFFKNFMSAMLFVATCLVYPVTVAGDFAAGYGWASFAALAAFFVPFEITYEILYDLRDLEGDRLARVPTYPVVHGEVVSAKIIDALLATSLVVLVVSVLAGVLGLREGLMAVAPFIQYGFYKARMKRGLTTRDCILLTWLGAALLAVWLAGTWAWEAAGLPANVWL